MTDVREPTFGQTTTDRMATRNNKIGHRGHLLKGPIAGLINLRVAKIFICTRKSRWEKRCSKVQVQVFVLKTTTYLLHVPGDAVVLTRLNKLYHTHHCQGHVEEKNF